MFTSQPHALADFLKRKSLGNAKIVFLIMKTISISGPKRRYKNEPIFLTYSPILYIVTFLINWLSCKFYVYSSSSSISSSSSSSCFRISIGDQLITFY